MTAIAEFFSTNSLLVSIVTLCFLTCLLALFYGQAQVRVLQRRFKKLENDLRITHDSFIGMGQQLIELEKQTRQSQQIFHEPKFTHAQKTVAAPDMTRSETTKSETTSSNSSYDRARQALASGLAVADVARECNLSYAEVSLLQSLRQHSPLTTH